MKVYSRKVIDRMMEVRDTNIAKICINAVKDELHLLVRAKDDHDYNSMREAIASLSFKIDTIENQFRMTEIPKPKQTAKRRKFCKVLNEKIK